MSECDTFRADGVADFDARPRDDADAPLQVSYRMALACEVAKSVSETPTVKWQLVFECKYGQKVSGFDNSFSGKILDLGVGNVLHGFPAQTAISLFTRG